MKSIQQTNSIIIAPSLLSANFSFLGKEIKQLETGGADWLHLDIMDGQFVPNITFGPIIVNAVNNLTNLTLDVHLMIKNPENYIEAFKKAGADIITVHQETCPHLKRTIAYIHELGALAGISLNPPTPISLIEEVIHTVDLVLIMSVNPGFGGQEFIPTSLQKIRETRDILNSINSRAYLEVDGGIDETNASTIVEAGCSVIVAGTGIFKYNNRSEGVQKLRAAALANGLSSRS